MKKLLLLITVTTLSFFSCEKKSDEFSYVGTYVPEKFEITDYALIKEALGMPASTPNEVIDNNAPGKEFIGKEFVSIDNPSFKLGEVADLTGSASYYVKKTDEDGKLTGEWIRGKVSDTVLMFWKEQDGKIIVYSGEESIKDKVSSDVIGLSYGIDGEKLYLEINSKDIAADEDIEDKIEDKVVAKFILEKKK